MTWILKGCSSCNGDLFLTLENGQRLFICLLCGRSVKATLTNKLVQEMILSRVNEWELK